MPAATCVAMYIRTTSLISVLQKVYMRETNESIDNLDSEVQDVGDNGVDGEDC